MDRQFYFANIEVAALCIAMPLRRVGVCATVQGCSSGDEESGFGLCLSLPYACVIVPATARRSLGLSGI